MILGAVLQFIGFVCVVLILEHAFRKSLAHGFLSLFMPLYIVYFMLTRLESKRKGLLIGGFAGLFLGPALIILTAP